MMPTSELTTMLTDYAIALEALIFAGLLWRLGSRHPQQSIALWGAAFLSVAIAAFMGGTYHGFRLLISDQSQRLLWKVTIYAIGFMSLFIMAGTVRSSVPRSLQRWLLLGIAGQSLVYFYWAATHNDFTYAVVEYFLALGFMLLLQIGTAIGRRSSSIEWMVLGSLVSLAAAALLGIGFSIAPLLHASDVYHLVQAGGLYLFYRGARLLKDVA